MKRRQKAKKSILVIGMGRFGKHLARKMQELGNSVMVVDMERQLEQDLAFTFNDYMIGDCTNENVITALGVGNFDICFVTIGKNFEASIVISLHLKNHGAKYIVTKVSRDIQTEVLKKIGVNDVIYPEREFAEKLAVRYNANLIINYFELAGDSLVVEIAVPTDWVDKSIRTLDIRRKQHVSILVVKNGAELHHMPSADYIFRPEDLIVLMGKPADVFRLTSQE